MKNKETIVFNGEKNNDLLDINTSKKIQKNLSNNQGTNMRKFYEQIDALTRQFERQMKEYKSKFTSNELMLTRIQLKIQEEYKKKEEIYENIKERIEQKYENQMNKKLNKKLKKDLKYKNRIIKIIKIINKILI